MATYQQSVTGRDIAPIILFASTLFCSASLMFILQPMFGKVLLPLLGGAPAVWNTCMVFFQTVLFLGYLYAHLLSCRLSLTLQAVTHGSVIAISVFSLPVALSTVSLPLSNADPTFWLLSVLIVSIGLPFFVLSTSAPLLQKWFSALGHKTSDDPYYLYVASNAGSLIALISYPFVLEPWIGLRAQQILWSVGYVLLSLMIVGCMLMLRKKRRQTTRRIEQEAAIADKPSVTMQFRWLALSLVPSSLLLALTNFISTDVAAVPLLWVLPLALYLASFVIVFSKYGAVIHQKLLHLYPWVVAPFLAYYFSNQKISLYWLEIAVHFLVFFFTIMVCHGELAKSRPHSRYLTGYYLIMSLGGTLGGMFNTFIAPVIFDNVYEYPLMFVAGLMLIFGKQPKFFENIEFSLTLKIGAAMLFFGLIFYLNHSGQLTNSVLTGLLMVAIFGYFCFLHKNFVSLAVFLSVIVSCNPLIKDSADITFYRSRNFFGILTIKERLSEKDQGLLMHVMYHGTTNHGEQLRRADFRCRPVGYYSHQGPFGQLFEAYDGQNQHWNIGVIGLGGGALAAYAKPDQHWTFYELNPAVIKIATTPHYFSYLQDCADNYQLYSGDARLVLEQEKNHQYDLLIIDAFSSDSIPMHLMTKEAVQIFLDNVKHGGLLAFHITNRHLDLKPVVAAHAKAFGLADVIQEFRLKKKTPLLHSSDLVVMAKDATTLQPLSHSNSGKWRPLPGYPDMRQWSDDFNSILSVLSFDET